MKDYLVCFLDSGCIRTRDNEFYIRLPLQGPTIPAQETRNPHATLPCGSDRTAETSSASARAEHNQ